MMHADKNSKLGKNVQKLNELQGSASAIFAQPITT
jgi:hypothetical protein